MRIESSVTAISWIPSEMVQGAALLPFKARVARHDASPPERLDGDITETLQRLRADGRFRIANHLDAWVDVEHGAIVGHGQGGAGIHGATTLHLGGSWTVAAIRFSDLRPPPVVGDGWVRFRQTVGGRTGVPAPRRVRRRPYLHVHAPPAWTTLELTIHVDGRHDAALVGASSFPRHWVYDHGGRLVAKSGVVDFVGWYHRQADDHTPWSGRDTTVAVAGPPCPLEHDLADCIMRGATGRRIRSVVAGETIIEQGDLGRDVALVLDGVARVVVDGREVAEVGPGAVIGERASVESCRRTATLVAVTACKLAVVRPGSVDPSMLELVSRGHRREDGPSGDAPLS